MAAKVEPRYAGPEQSLTGSSIAYAVVASLVIGGPLLGMMGFVLLATLTLLAVASPLLLLFSPVLVPAALLLAGTMASFGVAVGMAFLGASSLMWAGRATGEAVPDGVKRRIMQLFGTGGGMDFGGYLKEKGDRYQPQLVAM